MAKVKTLKDNGELFYPQTHIDAVVDDSGNTITEIIDEVEKKIPSKVSQLDNDKQYATTSSVSANTKAINDEIARATQAESDAIEKGRILALRSLFVAAGAEYNDTDEVIIKTAPWGDSVEHLPKHYYLNGLGDITEEQMMDIYNAGRPDSGNCSYLYIKNTKIRTNLPKRSSIGGYSPISLIHTFLSCSKIETVQVCTDMLYAKEMAGSFTSCRNLERIIGIITTGSMNVWYNFEQTFHGCEKLTDVKIRKLVFSVSFKDSSLISKESILYAITEATPTTAITITLHPDAYTRLVDDTDIVAALEEKNASLVTEGKGGSISLVSA